MPSLGPAGPMVYQANSVRTSRFGKAGNVYFLHDDLRLISQDWKPQSHTPAVGEDNQLPGVLPWDQT